MERQPSPPTICHDYSHSQARQVAGTRSHENSADCADLLAAIGWLDSIRAKLSRDCTGLLVGHQPTLGRPAALLLAGSKADWSFKKGAVWWFSRRVREGDDQVVLRAVVGSDLL